MQFWERSPGPYSCYANRPPLNECSQSSSSSQSVIKFMLSLDLLSFKRPQVTQSLPTQNWRNLQFPGQLVLSSVTHLMKRTTDFCPEPSFSISATASPCSLHEFPGTCLLTRQLPGAIKVEGCVPEKTWFGLAHQHLQRLIPSAVLRPRNGVEPVQKGEHISFPSQGLQIEASFLVPHYMDALNFYFKNTFPDSYKMGIKPQVPILKYI